jgi:hypothetical protein
MGHGSAHTLNAIKQLALVVFGVTEIDDGESDQNCQENSHSFSLRAENNKPTHQQN